MLKTEFSFELITQNDRARVGRIKTIRGEIDTPAFMPVGTCLLYTSPSPRDKTVSRMPSSA